MLYFNEKSIAEGHSSSPSKGVGAWVEDVGFLGGLGDLAVECRGLLGLGAWGLGLSQGLGPVVGLGLGLEGQG